MKSPFEPADKPTGKPGAKPPLLLNLDALTEDSLSASSHALASAVTGASSRQQAAARVVSHFFESYRDARSGEPAFVLARCFQTCAYAGLPLHYRDAADRLLDNSQTSPDTRCLALLATRGIKSLWNDPVTSVGHQAIPLPSVEVVRQAPMIARLFDQLGLPIEDLVATTPTPDMLLHEDREFNVFHIAHAPGSPFIPAQEHFVQPFGVRSVVGLGGLLPSGELFAVILFSRTSIERETALRLGSLAGSIRQALLSFSPQSIFLGPGI